MSVLTRGFGGMLQSIHKTGDTASKCAVTTSSQFLTSQILQIYSHCVTLLADVVRLRKVKSVQHAVV